VKSRPRDVARLIKLGFHEFEVEVGLFYFLKVVDHRSCFELCPAWIVLIAFRIFVEVGYQWVNKQCERWVGVSKQVSPQQLDAGSEGLQLHKGVWERGAFPIHFHKPLVGELGPGVVLDFQFLF
jgi:hypothetical protein